MLVFKGDDQALDDDMREHLMVGSTSGRNLTLQKVMLAH